MHLIIFLKYQPVRCQRTWEKLFPDMSTFGVKFLLIFLVLSMYFICIILYIKNRFLSSEPYWLFLETYVSEKF